MENKVLRILCTNLSTGGKEPGLQWLIGAPFLPFTIISCLKCIHTDDEPFAPDYAAEADNLQVLLPRGLQVIGALFVSEMNYKDNALRAGDIYFRLRRHLLPMENESFCVIGAAAAISPDNIQFFTYIQGKSSCLEAFESVVHEEKPTECLWDSACLLQCQMKLNLPVYLSSNRSSDNEDQFSLVIDEISAILRGPRAVFMAEGVVDQSENCSTIILRNIGNSNSDSLPCSNLCSSQKFVSSASGVEIPEPIKVTVFLQRSDDELKAGAPSAEYFPAKENIRLMELVLNLDVLCLASKQTSLAAAVSKLLIPCLIDQLKAIKKAGALNIRTHQPELCAYHFCPPGMLHPVTTIYDLSFGETEMNQVEVRRKLHSRLKLPLDRPLVRVANCLTLTAKNVSTSVSSSRKASMRLSNVHVGLPRSGVAGGQMSLIEGYYEYYHYLQDDFDDNGWGCAYRSLQTIISWFGLQHYTLVEVPSHRKIQETLVEIGDKEPSFIGSREWIGAIELSFVLDKLLGVSCKILNVRSGAELPEKCRELALHFQTQGTPVMIGGGVLAYSLLGVDYNELTGDCAFLILDPHYTGADDLNSIQAGGWCGWKKAVSSKGKEFFLRDKFYNLLLPQRPNMV